MQPPLPCGLDLIDGNSYSQFHATRFCPPHSRGYVVARAWCVQVYKVLKFDTLILVK